MLATPEGANRGQITVGEPKSALQYYHGLEVFTISDTKIGAAYIRASTDDQLEYSPDSQRSKILEYAKREGYIIPDEYIFQDDGISGKAADKRPAFRIMIGHAKEDNPPFDCIFVWEFSRFARNQEESIMYKNLLKKRGVAVKSVREPLADSPFATLIERIIEWMDEYYLINLAIEVRRGMAEKATRGEAMGTAPFGYTCKDKTFYPNENADTIRWIFEQFAAGKGSRTLATELNAMGVKTRRGNAPDNRWVHYILTNPAYIGKIRWSTEGHANYDRRDYNGENVLLVDGKHPPIIDMPLWDKVQQRLTERPTEAKYRRNGSKMFMLKGLCRCGDCGATLTLLSAASPSLQCCRYGRGQCAVSHCITLKKANAAAIAALEEAADNESFNFTPSEPPKKAVRRDWDKLIASEENRIRRAKNALLDGVFTTDEYKAAKAEAEDNISKLKDAKREEEEQLPTPPSPAVMEKKAREVLNIIKSPDASEETKNAALRSIIDKIVYAKPLNTLDIYFSM